MRRSNGSCVSAHLRIRAISSCRCTHAASSDRTGMVRPANASRLIALENLLAKRRRVRYLPVWPGPPNSGRLPMKISLPSPRAWIVLAVVACGTVGRTPAFAQDDELQAKAFQLLKLRCFRCHGEEQNFPG